VIENLIGGQIYLLYIIFIMLAVGMVKENNLFAGVYAYIIKAVKSKRAVIALTSAFTGILPIPGRVTTSAGILDTMAPKKGKGREKYGTVDYLATHHYYMWSPLEKTIIVPMGALGLTYGALMGILAPILVVSIALILGYIFYAVKETDVSISAKAKKVDLKISTITRNVVPFLAAIGAVVYGVAPEWAFGALTLYYMILTMTWDYKKLLGYINWNVIITVAVIIALANFAREHTNDIKTILEGTVFDISTLTGWVAVTLVGFAGAFALGSSSRFVALSVLLASVYGTEYFLWFFAVEFVGYLMSPTHKCCAIGMTYFGTPLKKYVAVLGLWGGLIMLTAGLVTFV